MTSRTNKAKRKAVDDAANKAKKAKGETNLGDGLRWIQDGEEVKGACPMIALISESLPGKEKIAGFDIDFTIIKTKSGRKFATGAKDWEMWDECVPDKLKELHKDGYRVVFFTNQAGIEKMKVSANEIKDKIEDIISSVGIPIMAFVCTGENHFRKPSTRMWDFLVEKCNQGQEVDLKKSFYVGDAAGRDKNWAPNKPKDFSCGDRMFAANIGIDFQTPEEFFLGEKKAKFDWRSLNPQEFLKKNPVSKKKEEYKSKNQEVVVMVGCPASGKSTFRRRYFEPHGYVVVNRDTMGTQEKCIKAAKNAVDEGKSVVADNTNPSVSAREPFIAIAKKKGIPCRCFYMQTSLELAHHLNYVRQNQTESKVRRIPDVGYNVYKKNFEEPAKAEGFSEIIKVDFVPQFDSGKDEKLFKNWT